MNKRFKFAGLTFLIYTIPVAILYYLPFFSNTYGHFQDFSPLPIIFLIIVLHSIYVLIFKKEITGNERVTHIYKGIIKVFLFVFKKGIKGDSGITEVEKVSLRFYLVKIFFTPLMVGFLLENSGSLYGYLTSPDFSFTKLNIYNFYYKFLFAIILFIDTGVFTFGYLVESKKLGNIVKSVEPTLLGWMVALMCYPPFNGVTGDVLGWHSNDFNNFGNMNATLFFGAVSLILFGIYVWATVALGWKSSNLTNRGIISKGPYKYVRHPAYISKNLSWWVMGIPFIIVSPFLSILSLSAWSFIYYMRAMTEERHLMADPDYIEYMKKTPNMFIPKIF